MSPRSAKAAGAHTSMLEDVHTCSMPVALAVQEGPPSPTARPRPIYRMGKAARC